jgi:hypothetical protein
MGQECVEQRAKTARMIEPCMVKDAGFDLKR